MSLGYAERLSFREDLGGRLGAREIFDDAATVVEGVDKLADMVRSAGRVVAFTGAGISTACGIPDFRGPNGVWTLQRAGKPLPKLTTSFVYAKPSLTHMALLALLQSGKLTYVCSQNVDGLHLRSGVPRSQLAELHGNCFAERCKRCGTEYIRDFEMETVGFKPSGRTCTKPSCKGAKLHDHILDWEDALPDDELDETERQADQADLSICLGTSLQIVPACNLPLRTLKTGGKLAIINLQATPKDRRATLVIHSKSDGVMALLLRRLGVQLPQFERTDRVVVSHRVLRDRPETQGDVGARRHEQRPASIQQQHGQQQGMTHEEWEQQQQQQQPQSAGAKPDVKGEQQQGPHLEDQRHQPGQSADDQMDSVGPTSQGGWGFELTLSSVHGPECPLTMVRSAHLSFIGAAGLSPARLEAAAAPLRVRRWVEGSQRRVAVAIWLELRAKADEDKRGVQLSYEITPDGAVTGSQTFPFVTQVQDYSLQQQSLCEELEASAAAARTARSAGGGAGRRAGRGRPPKAPIKQAARYEEREVDSQEDLDSSDVSLDDEDWGPGGRRSGSASGRSTASGRSLKRTKRLNL